MLMFKTEEKYCMTSAICELKKKKKATKDTNELIYITKQKETHRLRRQTYVARAERIVGELEVVLYTLMY